MQVSDAIAQIELAEEEVVSSGLSIDIMEIKPSVSTELIDGLKGRCPRLSNRTDCRIRVYL